MLEDCFVHSLDILGDFVCSGAASADPPTTACGLFLTTYDSHIIEKHLFIFKPYYKAIATPYSKLEDYIGTMHLAVHALLYILFFRPCYKIYFSSSSRLGDQVGTLHLAANVFIF